MHGGEHADPAIGQRRLSRHQLGMVHLARADGAGSGEKEDDDGQERERRDDEVEGQCRQHAAIVEPGQEHDHEDDKRPLVELGRVARQTGDLGDEIACGDRVAASSMV